MGEKAIRVSQFLVRTVATITLVYFTTGAISDRYYPAWSRALANSRLGQTVGIFAIAAAFFLPPYVGLEWWWTRRSGLRASALWIDAALALACFALFTAVILYAFGHYLMF
jgi:hypothetical protein